MFGLGIYAAYGQYSVGGVNASLLVALTMRLAVGIGWYRLFDRADKNPILAFVPFVGCYTAFKMVWDDFSLSVIFASTTFVAFVAAVGIDYPLITGLAILNFILWWLMCLLTCTAFNFSMVFGFLAGGIPWIGLPVMGFLASGSYHGPWSSDPEADQNLTSEERKKKRRKEEKEAKRKQEEEKKAKKK